MMEDGKGICCPGFLRELFCVREFRIGLLIWKSEYFKRVTDAFKVRWRTYIWRTEVRSYMPYNQANHEVRRPKDTIGFYRTSWWVMMPAVAMQSSFLLFYLLVRFLPSLGGAIIFSRHDLFSASAFCLFAVASPPCCLPPLHLIPTFLCRRGWRVSAAILRLSGWPCRLQRWDLPSGTRPTTVLLLTPAIPPKINPR